MKSLIAFTKKEIKEQIRSGRLTMLGLIFVLLGIMNPATAKLTPWLLEVMADSLAESGMIVTEVKVNAMDSWMQFFKNIPLGLTAFVLLESGIFTKEYSSGTLILSFTKGLERYKALLSKTMVLFVLWTLAYFMCFGITFAYNAYFWDNSVAQNLIFSVLCWWIFGLMVISLIIFFSTVTKSGTGVLLGVGSFVLLSYLIGLLPKCSKYLPTFLTEGTPLIYGLAEANNYTVSLLISILACIFFTSISIPIFNKKEL